MRIVYKRTLLFIGVLIIAISCIGIGYLFYDKVIHPDIEVAVQDELSINYLDGSTIIQDGRYQFSVTNSGANDVNYRIILEDIQGFTSDITYQLSSSNASIMSEEMHLAEIDNVVADGVLIRSGDTQNFTLQVAHMTSSSFKIRIEKVEDIEEYFYMTLLNNNEVKNNSEEIVGLLKGKDDEGTTYYFRGNVENNYVSFANHIWRIIRINGDGTVRLILDDIDDTLVNYNSDTENHEDFTGTDLYQSLATYYSNYLNSFDKYIANTKFCSEAGKTDDTYNAYTRLVTDEIPTFNCLGERYTSKIGLITADEVVMAGGVYNEENKEYYLYNENIDNLWWTSSLSKIGEDSFYPFLVDNTGKLVDNVNGSLYRSLRPVISLNRTVVVTGNGTKDNPYVVN